MNSELGNLRKKRAEELMSAPSNRAGSFVSGPEKLSDVTFDDYVKGHGLAVVDCYADWCMPCRMVSPIIEDLSKEMQGKVAFGKLNVDENQAIAMRYRVMSIPTLLIFKDGKLIDTIVGAMPKTALKSRIEGY